MGFDERFFLYCEDLDFCRRVYESGNIVLVNPDIKVNHLFQRQSRKSIILFFIHLNSVIKYYVKWYRKFSIKELNLGFRNLF